MTICTVSYKEEAFFFQAELLHYSAATATDNMLRGKKKNNHTSGLDNVKKLILLTSSCLE